MKSSIRPVKRNEGFTIIEVLIVLAIAGLILLVVFLAVPALQRNARNTQRSTDAGNILSAVSEFVGNNNGVLPAVQTNLGSGQNATLGSGTGINTIPITLGYYDAGNVSVVQQSSYGTTNNTTTDTAVLVRAATCDGNNPAAGSTRAIVVLYTLENDSKQCRSS